MCFKYFWTHHDMQLSFLVLLALSSFFFVVKIPAGNKGGERLDLQQRALTEVRAEILQ